MKARIAQVNGAEHAAVLLKLQRDTFPADEKVDPDGGFWWLAFDGKVPVAFCAMEGVASWDYTGYISRVGVLQSHRGNGLQRRLMRACERKARELGWVRIISTTLENPPSANNFIALGYRTYLPTAPWGYAGTIYWLKELK